MLGLLGTAVFMAASQAQGEIDKPNILVIWGDDVGCCGVGGFNQGMMGCQTPNRDSIANEGALFTDWYTQQSCTAGRTAFIQGEEFENNSKAIMLAYIENNVSVNPGIADKSRHAGARKPRAR